MSQAHGERLGIMHQYRRDYVARDDAALARAIVRAELNRAHRATKHRSIGDRVLAFLFGIKPR